MTRWCGACQMNPTDGCRHPLGTACCPYRPAPMTPLPTMLGHIGWTTGELARRLGVTDGTVRNWVTGRRSPSPSVLLWLADIAAVMDRAQPLPDGWDGGHVGRPRVSG